MLASDQHRVVCFGALIEREGRYLSVKFRSLDILTQVCKGQRDHHLGLLNDGYYCQIGLYAELEDKDLLNDLRTIFKEYTECSAVVVISGILPLGFATVGRVPVSINIYGLQKHGDAIVNALQSSNLYLQNPDSVREGIIYDNPSLLGSVDQTWIGRFIEEIRWRNVMRLIIYNFMPLETLEKEMLELIKPGLESGMSKKNHSKAVHKAKAALKDWATQNHVQMEKMAEGEILPNFGLAPCPCSDCTSQSYGRRWRRGEYQRILDWLPDCTSRS